MEFTSKKSAVLMFFLFPALVLTLAVSLPCRGGDPKAESKKFFQKGIKLYNKGQTEDALVQFHKAYVIYPHWKIRKNIGLCYMKLGDNVLALQELYGYLEEGKSELGEKEKQAVMNVIFSIIEKVGIVRFTNLPPNPKVVIDGQYNNDAQFGKDIYVDPGLHVISVMTKDEQLLYREEMYITEGELKEIDVTKAATPVTTTPESTSQIPGWQEVGPPKERKLKVLHPAIFGVSVALTLASGVAIMGTGIKAQITNKRYWDEEDPVKQDELEKDGKKYEKITNVLIGPVVGFAAVSIVLFFFTDFKKGKPKEEPMPGFALVPCLQKDSFLLSAELRF